jgi:hypothetical protein
VTGRSGYDQLDDRFDRYAGKVANRPWWRTFAGLLGIVVAVVVVVAVVFGVLGFIGAWGGEAKRIASPANVRQQHTLVIQDWEAAQRAADNACGAQDAAPRGPDAPTLVEDPAQAYAATYRNIVTDYNRRQRNLFEAKLVRPAGYPGAIPASLQPVGPKADWCAVSAGLRELHE